MSTTVLPTPPNDENALQKAIDAIETEYNEVEAAIEEMEADGKALINDKNSKAYKDLVIMAKELGVSVEDLINAQPGSKLYKEAQSQYRDDEVDLFGWIIYNPWHESFNSLMNYGHEIAALEAQVKADEAQVEKYYPDFKAMDDALNSLLNDPDALLSKNLRSGDFQADMQNLLKIFDGLISSMQLKAATERDQAIMTAAVNDNDPADSAFSSKILLQAALQSIGDQSQEQSSLYDLQDSMQTMYEAYDKAYYDAKADKSSIDWKQNARDFFKGCLGDQKAKDEAIMRNAEEMEGFIDSIRGAITPELSSMTSSFTMLSVTMDNMLKKIAEILKDVNMSPTEKQVAILSLVMGALTILSECEQESAKEKSRLEQRMSKASSEASEAGVTHSMAEQEIMANEMKQAAELKVLMKVCMIIVGCIMTLLAPGYGAMIAMAAITALEASGVMDQLTEKLTTSLANAGCPNAKIFAEIIVGAIEIVATIGAGAICDQIGSAVEGAAMEAAETAIADVLENIVKEAAEQAMKNVGTNAAKTAVTDFVTEGVQNTTQSAMKQAFKKFFEQNAVKLITSLVKSAVKKGEEKVLTEAVAQSMKEAGTSAAKQFVKKTADLAEKIAEGDVLSTVDEQAAKELEESCAKQAVETLTGKTTKSTGENVAKEEEGRLSQAWGKVKSVIFSRPALATAYAIGSNNLPTEIATEAQKARGKKVDDQSFQNLLLFLQVFQQMLVMFAMAGSCGGASNFGGASNLMTLLNGISAAGMATSGAASISEGEISKQKAKTDVAMAEQNAMLDMVNFIVDQMQKDGSQEREKAIAEIEEQMKSTYTLSSHLFDGDAQLARVLSDQAV